MGAIETHPVFESLSTSIWLWCDWVHALRIQRVEGLERLTNSSGMHCHT